MFENPCAKTPGINVWCQDLGLVKCTFTFKRKAYCQEDKYTRNCSRQTAVGHEFYWNSVEERGNCKLVPANIINNTTKKKVSMNPCNKMYTSPMVSDQNVLRAE